MCIFIYMYMYLHIYIELFSVQLVRIFHIKKICTKINDHIHERPL